MPDDVEELPPEEPRRPTLEEILERAAKRRGGRVSLKDAAEYVRQDRDRR